MFRAVLTLVLAVAGITPASAQNADVEINGDARADSVAISVTGNATAGWVQVCAPFPLPVCQSLVGLAISGTGNATCFGHVLCLAASGTGDSSGGAAVSGTGDSSGFVAISATGEANGTIAVSGCSLAPGCGESDAGAPHRGTAPGDNP